ncbi:hypothetical protein [Bradyrhizobium sp. AZCC 1693]|uniref:hypothetical protein n=1 Tax=Bradyrhizobium sp. AZCC 1693 TaxID=3117029 RepID=UPI002FEEEBD2
MHIDTITDIVEPAPETVAGFSFRKTVGQGGFNLSKPLRRIFRNLFTPPENDLTCRANHRHNAIIAKIAKARMEKSVAGFLFEIPQSDGGRTSTPQLPTPPAGRRERAVVRALLHTNWPACANMPACGVDRHAPHAAPDGIRFAPQMICACTAIMPHVCFFIGEKPMTAYLNRSRSSASLSSPYRRSSRERRNHSVHPAPQTRRRTNGFSDNCLPLCRS